MKKRVLILAMAAFMVTASSDYTISIVHAEEASELPVKALTPKAMDVNPYMAASDSNIHHDCYNTDSTDEVLLIFILRSMFLMKKLIPMLPRQSFLIPMDILWFHFWVAWRSVILMQMRHRPWAIFHQNSMTMEAT